MGQVLHRVLQQPQVHFLLWLGRQYLGEVWGKMERKTHRRRHPHPPPPSPPPSTFAPTPPPTPPEGDEVHVYSCPHHGRCPPDVCFLW